MFNEVAARAAYYVGPPKSLLYRYNYRQRFRAPLAISKERKSKTQPIQKEERMADVIDALFGIFQTNKTKKFQTPIYLTINDPSLDTPEVRDPTTFALLRPASFGSRTAAPGEWVELPTDEAEAILKQHGQYKAPVLAQEGPKIVRPFDERTETRF
jgi:hypothetical protein